MLIEPTESETLEELDMYVTSQPKPQLSVLTILQVLRCHDPDSPGSRRYHHWEATQG